jgi:MFS family permease
VVSEQSAVPVATATTDQAAAPRRAWTVVALLFSLVVVNFADKIVVALAGPDVKHDLHIGDAAFGVAQSSFFWLFAVGSVLGGWLGGKVPARWLLAGVAAVWALSAAPLVGQVGFTALVACRVLLGLAEGPTTALTMYVTHSWFPAERRALPSSVVTAGATVGPLVAAPTLTWIITQHSWHLAFGVLAVVGLLFAGLWLVFGRTGPYRVEAAPDALPERLPLRRIFGSGTMMGILILLFVSYGTTAVKLTWLPLYLEEGLGYSKTTAASIVALIYLGMTVFVVLVGLVSRTMTKRGMSHRASRGVLASCLVLGAALATFGFAALGRGPLQITLLVLSSCLYSAGYGVAFAGVSDVVPSRQRGTVLGIVGAVYSVAGILTPAMMGSLAGHSGTPRAGYDEGFFILGAAMLVGSLIALFLINPERDASRLSEAR